MTKPIDLIHQAAIASAHPKLPEHVIIASPELQHLLTSVTMPGDWRYMDVPCTAVVGVQNPERGAPPEPFNWRQAALCLHGELDGRVAAILAYAGDGALEFVQLHAPAQLDQLAELAGARCDLAVRRRGGSQESLLAFPTLGGPAIEVRPRSGLQRLLANREANEARDTGWFDWMPLPAELLLAWGAGSGSSGAWPVASSRATPSRTVP